MHPMNEHVASVRKPTSALLEGCSNIYQRPCQTDGPLGLASKLDSHVDALEDVEGAKSDVSLFKWLILRRGYNCYEDLFQKRPLKAQVADGGKKRILFRWRRWVVDEQR